VIVVELDLIADSCGYSVPTMTRSPTGTCWTAGRGARHAGPSGGPGRRPPPQHRPDPALSRVRPTPPTSTRRPCEWYWSLWRPIPLTGVELGFRGDSDAAGECGAGGQLGRWRVVHGGQGEAVRGGHVTSLAVPGGAAAKPASPPAAGPCDREQRADSDRTIEWQNASALTSATSTPPPETPPPETPSSSGRHSNRCSARMVVAPSRRRRTRTKSCSPSSRADAAFQARPGRRRAARTACRGRAAARRRTG